MNVSRTEPQDRYLAVDLGGTHARLAWCRGPRPRWWVEVLEHYENAQFSGLDAIVAAFMERHPYPYDAAAIAVAGPVLERVAHLTNLNWSVDATQLERQWARPVQLINDMEAHAHGAVAIHHAQHELLQAGRVRADGNAAMIAIGTGLGEVIMARDGEHFLALPSEGGHCDFAPGEGDDLVLWSRLAERYGGHVSWERVVSGRDGLRHLYEHLCALGRISVPHPYAREIEGLEDIGAVISRADQNGEAFAQVLLSTCARLYGAEAGNLALKALATGGFYVGGQLSQRILTAQRLPVFLHSFAAKGRFRDLLRAIPIRLVKATEAPLLGAASVAARRAQGMGARESLHLI